MKDSWVLQCEYEMGFVPMSPRQRNPPTNWRPRRRGCFERWHQAIVVKHYPTTWTCWIPCAYPPQIVYLSSYTLYLIPTFQPPPQAISVPVLPRKVFSKSLVFLKLVWWFFSWKIVSYAIWLYVILVAGPTWDVCLKHIWSFLLIFSMISIIENMGVQWFLFPTISLLQLHETLDYYKMVTKSTLMHLSPTYLFLSNIATIFNRFDTISIIKHP